MQSPLVRHCAGDTKNLKRKVVFRLLIVGLLLFCGVVFHFRNTAFDDKWSMIVIMTLFIFGFVCSRTQDFWADPWYWVILTGAFLLHVLVVVLVQRNFPMFPGVYYSFLGTLEAIILLGLIIFRFNR